ncbi:MAG: hypothetical protein K9W45_06155 [Candidatus Heimdallarchaeum aukensis]|uniref:Uncharacterized protein n=1 Tax=Candidatus Heimdallarchaeum aukensis TaxID=2876573 RepID=A0A9Y1FMN3_9ARCH|nr:MAG: hypothetical protein K9W45_06155 [Candidatus Heimdallarchaeum aukensis]
MHVGFIIRELTEEEINHKCLYVFEKDRILFPNTGVLFFVESYEETYGVRIDQDGFLRGLETWFTKYPHNPGDTIIIAKTSESFSLSSSSELIQQIIGESYEKVRVDEMDEKSEACPNCQYQLEMAAKKEERIIFKCARCGFTMVRKIKDNENEED